MYCVRCGKNIGEDAAFCQFCGTRVTGGPVYTPVGPKRLMRSRYDKKVAGVCAGVARYLDLDINLVRLVWLLAFLLAGTGGLAYLIGWVLMPMEPDVAPAVVPKTA